MNYANSNNLNNNTCYHCQKGIDTHKINIITSDAATETLAKSLQMKLDGVYATALTKGYQLPQAMVMVGAVIATVGTVVIKAAALSGGNANTILNIIHGGLGTDVALLGDNVAPGAYRSLVNMNISKLATYVEGSRNGQVNVVPPIAPIALPNYPVGSCAAQKLVGFIVQNALANNKRIMKINMAEIFWKTNATSSQWSTGSLVESCNTCRYILPMMLCNYDDEGNKLPYP